MPAADGRRMNAQRPRLGRRHLLAGVALLVGLAAAAVAVTDPFTGHAASHDSSLDNGSPISTRRVERTSLASQTQVSGTLGYAGTWTVSVPSGTDPSALAQAEQAVSSARAALAAARATVTADARSQRASAKASLASAQRALAAAESSATSYGSTSSYTMLPSPGRLVRRGQPLFAINGQPTVLLYGSTPAWRAFRAGMSSGTDVTELNANLNALGFGAPSGDVFTRATSAAISALQLAHRLPQTGTLYLGAALFEPGPLRVKAVTPTAGQAVQPGPLLTASSTRHDVSVPLDAAQQSEVKVGDRVGVTLPDDSTTTGVVTSVGKVATTPAAEQQAAGSSSSPTINVDVRLRDARAAGQLDQAPVQVSITEQSVRNVLAVPVDALVALAGGGYAVEEVDANGVHRLVAVTPGLFDDARGLVQVAGSGLAVGRRVVVPAS